MNPDEFLPDAKTVAAIEKDIATYNQRREAEHAALARRKPALMTAYAVGAALLTYLVYRLFAATDLGIVALGAIPVLALLEWPRVSKWVKRDAEWTQQNFRDHIVPVMLGFVPDLRYSHGIRPRSFGRIPKALLPQHDAALFDDVISASIDGLRFELFEAKLVMRSKNSETVLFQGVVLSCRRRENFPGLLAATRRTGDFRRFLRDLFGTGGLEEIVVREQRLSDLYEFRTDNRAAARKLLSDGLAGMLVSISKLWPREAPQIAAAGDGVYILLPTTRDFFELPPLDRSVSYRSHIEPMARQFASFLAIVREVGRLDAPLPEAEPVKEETPPPAAEAPEPAEEEPFVRLLDGGEPPATSNQ